MDNLILYIILVANSICIVSCGGYLYYIKRRQRNNRDIILNELNITEVPPTPPPSPIPSEDIRKNYTIPSEGIRKNYINELITEYIETYPDVSLQDVIINYNNFKTTEDVKNIKNILQNTKS
jgi:hypothetical protein